MRAGLFDNRAGLIYAALLVICFMVQTSYEATVIARNPLLQNDTESYPDPWVILTNNTYYYCGSEDSARLYITFSANLKDIIYQEKHYIYTPPSGFNYSEEVWAPELHFLEGRWYVYFAADDGNNDNHRMFVLEGGSDSLNPLNGNYELKSHLKPTTDNWGIDGSPFVFQNQIYYVWSGWPGTTNVMQCIYISKMINPYTIDGERVEISCPTEDWEKNGNPLINEGPEVLISGNKVNIVYSASGSWTDDYCLGVLTNTNGNLMNKQSWVKTGPAFGKQFKVFGTGHASFVDSKDGLESWLVYHAAKYQGGGWNRNVRIQPFTYHENVPYFGPPIQPGVKMAVVDDHQVLPGGVYKIRSKFNSLYIGVQGGSKDNSAPIVLSKDDEKFCTRWQFTYNQNTGYYKITALCSDKNLDNTLASTNAGNKIIQYQDNGNDAQLWRVYNMEGNTFKIANKRSLLYLDVAGDLDVPLIQWYASNDDSQLFYLDNPNPTTTVTTAPPTPVKQTTTNASSKPSILKTSWLLLALGLLALN